MSKPELHLVSESGTGLRHFHAALRRMASGLCVVTAGHDDDISGVTVASLTSLSIEPPRLLINLSQHASVCRLIARDRWFRDQHPRLRSACARQPLLDASPDGPS